MKMASFNDFLSSLILICFQLGLFHESNASAVFYITPLLSKNCPVQSCPSLFEFAGRNDLNSDTNATIALLPGKHNLDQNISFSNLIDLRVYSESNATVVCTLSSFLSFENIERVYIQNVNFVGCGGNLVKNVDNFILRETTFKGEGQSGTALTIINTTAEIIDCTFVRN